MTQQTPYPHVFQPLDIGPVTVRNRLFMSPHAVRNHAVPDPALRGFYLPGPGLVDYFAARAAGGLGLMIQGSTVVQRSAQSPDFFELFAPQSVPAFREVTDAVHSHGGAIFVQLMHGGHHADLSARFGGPVSASSVPAFELGQRFQPRSMTVVEIAETVAAFGLAAANARDAGYDGIEIHGSHAYLLEQFLSPFFNHRTDEYGGSLENRLRFPLAVLEAVRASVGKGLAVGVRLIADELLPGGLGTSEMRDICAAFDEAGVDFINLGPVGTYHVPHLLVPAMQLPPRLARDAMAEVRGAIRRAAVLGVPTRLSTPEAAEEMVSSGLVDMAGSARTFFAEPEFANKASLGHADQIRPCVAVNACQETGRCAVNPANQRERELPSTLPASSRAKDVMVIGAGPGGMEAARTAALRGHRVTLYDRSLQVGGALNLMAAVPGRELMSDAVQWWSAQLKEQGVAVHTGIHVDKQVVRDRAPDCVVIATGSIYDTSGASGLYPYPLVHEGGPAVLSPEEVLGYNGAAGGLGDRESGRVVVLDDEGFVTGLGVAEVLARQGWTVDFVTRWASPAPRLDRPGNQAVGIVSRLLEAGVSFYTSSYLRETRSSSVVLYSMVTGAERVLENVDAMVFVNQRAAVDELVERLRPLVPELHCIGDASQPRMLVDATSDGHRVGRLV